MKRIMILGGAGSGKSTMALWLGAQTGLPVKHLDHVHWMPHWTPRPNDERLAMVRGFEQQERWIIEGGISTTYPTRMARAELLVWLDMPVSLRLWRVLRRSWRYRGAGRPDLPEGCIERFDRETATFLHWIWTDREKGRQRILENLLNAPKHLEVHQLRSPSEVTAFQSTLAAR